MAYTDDGKYKYQERWQQGNTKRYSIKLFLATDSDIIEKLAYISENKFFRTVQFRRALIDYRKNGLRSKKAWSVTHKPKR